MKKILFALALFTIASCNSTKQLTSKLNDFLVKHNYTKTAVYNPITKSTTVTVSIENLYDTGKLKDICSQADVTFKIVQGKVILTANCPGAEQKIEEIVKQLTNAIVFKK